MHSRNRFVGLVLGTLAIALAYGAPAEATCSPTAGCITYTLETTPRTVYRINAIAGATAENVSTSLNAIAPAVPGGFNDQQLNTSPDGQWLVLTTGRFDTANCPNIGGCLAVVNGNITAGEVVHVGGNLPANLIAPNGLAAIANGGLLVVYVDTNGTHARDLFALKRTSIGGTWTRTQLTGASTFSRNYEPAVKADGSAVVFACGNNDDEDQINICEVSTTGTGFRTVYTSAQLTTQGLNPGGTLNTPDYEPNGAIVFENEQFLLRLPPLPAPQTAVPINSEGYTNDVSPCVLTDGRIVSLWLTRPGNNAGVHELKVMSSDGAAPPLFVLNPNQDTFDVGIGCGGGTGSATILTSFLTANATGQSYSSTPASPDFLAGGVFSFNANYCNATTNVLTSLYSQVGTLGNNNSQLNRTRAAPTGVAGGPGAQSDIAATNGYSDLSLTQSECVSVPYQIGLTARAPFQFRVNIKGVSN